MQNRAVPAQHKGAHRRRIAAIQHQLVFYKIELTTFLIPERRHRTRRIVFASSNHVTGFYRQDEVITPKDPVRPDGFYGLSKAFGENLAQLYWD